VAAYNTRLIASTAAPKAYGDLLEPRWNGQLAFEQTAIEWFATLLRHWGEDKGLAFMRRLAGQNLKILNGNTLITQLVAAGEHAGAVALNGPRVELTKRRGAPIEWLLSIRRSSKSSRLALRRTRPIPTPTSFI
jgi:iron(III) transport system substrate-binding protein